MIERFAGYELLVPLEHSRMSELWFVRKPSNAGFAKGALLKRWRPDRPPTAHQWREQLLEEARAPLLELQHPGLLQHYMIDQYAERTFVVREYVPGLSLADLFEGCARRSLALPLELGVQIATRLCETLAYLHAQQGAHLDLRPEHVLISFLGEIKLIGLVETRIIERLGAAFDDATGLFEYQVAHMSPEQILGIQSGPRSDIFSMGILLYQLVTSVHPFTGEEQSVMVRAILQEPIPPPSQLNPKIPESLERIIQEALIRDPKERPDSASEMALALSKSMPDPQGSEPISLSRFLRKHFPAERLAAQSLLSRVLEEKVLEDDQDTPRFLGAEALLPPR